MHFLEAIFGALAEADLAHLGVRADRLGQSALDRFDAGVKSRGDGAHAWRQNGELAFGGSDRTELGLVLVHASGFIRTGPR